MMAVLRRLFQRPRPEPTCQDDDTDRQIQDLHDSAREHEQRLHRIEQFADQAIDVRRERRRRKTDHEATP